MIKGVREGHEVSNWTNPNAIYEAALQRFVRGVLDGSRANPFLADPTHLSDRWRDPALSLRRRSWC
jgi:maltooligosyltrehalose synthase